MIESFPSVKSFGMNCATGPVEMAPHIRFLGQNSTRPIAIQPNAGLPIMEAGAAVYKLTPEQLQAWRKAVAPMQAQWNADVGKAGYDGTQVMESLKTDLAKYGSAL